jgi:hypothetical protein
MLCAQMNYANDAPETVTAELLPKTERMLLVDGESAVSGDETDLAKVT